MILITGATGHVGSELVAQLVLRGEKVRALTRRPAAARFPAGVEVAGGDFDDPASVERALQGISRVFLLTMQATGSGPMPEHDLLVAALARRAGARHIVKLSVLGGGGDDPNDPITRWHRRVEAAVKGSGIAWTLLRPGRFMSNALQWAPMLKTGDKVHLSFAERPAASIDPYDIAAVATVALTEPGHEGRAYELSGPEALTPLQELEVLGGLLGRKLHPVALPAQAARDGMLRMGMPSEVVDAILVRAETSDHGSEVLPTVEQVTGRPARTFASWAEAHLAAFR